MPWFKVDDRLYSHPKWMAASMPARGLWATAGSWCAGNSHEGMVPAHALTLLRGTRRQAEELVERGLWEEVEGGWLFHDWLHFQPSTQQVEAERTAARERQRKARVTAASRRDSTVSHADVTPVVTVPPTRPDPTRVPVGQNTWSPPVTALVPVAPVRSSGLATRDDLFEEFWKAYPKKRDKPQAKKAWAAAIKRATPGEIVAGAYAYANDPDRTSEFTKNPQGWLSGDRWTYVPEPPKQKVDKHIASAQAWADQHREVIEQ